MPDSFRDPLYHHYVTGHQGVLDASRRYPTMKRDVLARLPSRRSARILDVGCGQGDLMVLLRRYGWTDVSGIDVSEEQVQTAVSRGVAGVVRADLFDYASRHPARYDVLIAMDFIEHFDRVQALQVFETLRGMLTRGGHLILQVPNGSSPFSGRVYWSDVTHGMQYTDRSLRQITTAAGFAAVDSFPSRPAIHGPLSAARAVIWRFVETGLWLATAAETGRARGAILTQNIVAVATNPD